ncbi:MAG TPA: hypothetical protein VMH04_17865 [Candidatus Solibacter sp.]|nr:hypothetical protein [Candidatus Solibacter sp.]
MQFASTTRSPHWYGVPVRVALLTFIGTLLCFAVSLLLAIMGTVAVAVARGVNPDMRVAYKMIALPMGIGAGCVVFIVALVIEIRHYRQNKTLSAIEKMG